MANILLTGIATLDIINQVNHYPKENEELRATGQLLRRGGNAANTADVLNQIGHNVTLNCVLAKDSSGYFIQDELTSRHISLAAEIPDKQGATPTSYITLNALNGSRTIVHHRDLAESSFEHFDQLDLVHFDWFHFEGRNINACLLMMKKAIAHKKTISLEIEKIRPDGDILQLMPVADILMLSKPFALSQGKQSATECLQFFSRQFPDKIISCSWGNKGAWIIHNSDMFHSPASISTSIVDTLGAGDTFNASLIDALIKQQSIETAVHSATELAGLKCTQYGFDNLIS